MLKRFSLLALALLLFLTGCAGFTGGSEGTAASEGKTEDGKVKIDFWTFWGSEIRRPVIDKIIEDFNNSQDEIVVEHTYIPFGDIWTKELAAIAANNPPDVVINDINATALRGQEGQAENLAPYLEEDDISGRFYENLWDATLYEGDSYGIPFNTDTRLLFYNKDAFKEAGLDPNKPPETWEELEEYAEKLDEKSGDTYERIGFYPLYGVGSDVWLLNGSGMNYFNENDEPVINSETNVDTMEWIKSWKDKYGEDTINRYQSQIDSQQSNPFFDGSLGMMANAATFYTQIRDYAPDLDFGVAPLPEKTSGSGHTSWGGGFVAEIPKGSSHPDEAWEFIKYLTDTEAQEYWAVKNFDNVANIEASESAATSDELSDKDQMVYEMAAQNLNDTLLTPMPAYAPDYVNLINPQLDAILLENKPAQEALDKAQQDVEELVEKTAQ
ncbi:ABC transporter substrate-binding protein [Terribacillus aidingensis]|uniref:ABC transporter substrate-binding protein n=1 Tax=Terribacillus aidingensis TaxID=586416 RepID=UPI00344BC0C1